MVKAKTAMSVTWDDAPTHTWADAVDGPGGRFELSSRPLATGSTLTFTRPALWVKRDGDRSTLVDQYEAVIVTASFAASLPTGTVVTSTARGPNRMLNRQTNAAGSPGAVTLVNEWAT